ncbi:DUF5133 domain-containing protein [Streptomyces sp. NPDC007110]|uniref:DUF5133 domain-containing protein n=1 Tax=Streptomyces sp. NPDC007110 TaxID=3156916 RepID=UPI0033EF59BE
MILPSEKELRAALARFAEVRFTHDVHPTVDSGRALEDATYTLCVMVGSRTVAEALTAADVLLQRFGADRKAAVTQEDKTLAA